VHVRTSVHVGQVLVLGSCWRIEQAASAVIEGEPGPVRTWSWSCVATVVPCVHAGHGRDKQPFGLVP
jgi:hypothetical protein